MADRPVGVDVCIPAYNEASVIGSCLRSLAAARAHFQHAQPAVILRLVVADGGSTDETPQMVRAFAAEVTLRLERSSSSQTTASQ